MPNKNLARPLKSPCSPSTETHKMLLTTAENNIVNLRTIQARTQIAWNLRKKQNCICYSCSSASELRDAMQRIQCRESRRKERQD